MDVKPVQRMQVGSKPNKSYVEEVLGLGSFRSSAGPIHDWYSRGYFQFNFNSKFILQSQLQARDVPVGVLRVARLLVRDSRERPSQKPNTGTLLALQRVNIAKCMRWNALGNCGACITQLFYMGEVWQAGGWVTGGIWWRWGSLDDQ